MQTKPLEHFKKATRLNPKDFDTWLEMGELQITMMSSFTLQVHWSHFRLLDPL